MISGALWRIVGRHNPLALANCSRPGENIGICERRDKLAQARKPFVVVNLKDRMAKLDNPDPADAWCPRALACRRTTMRCPCLG